MFTTCILFIVFVFVFVVFSLYFLFKNTFVVIFTTCILFVVQLLVCWTLLCDPLNHLLQLHLVIAMINIMTRMMITLRSGQIVQVKLYMNPYK